MGQVVYFGLCLLGCLLFNPAIEGTQNSSRLSSRSQCPPGVLYYNRFCYEFFSDPASWEDAELECRYWRKGGHLASIRSATEEKRISSYITRLSSTSIVWLGLQATPMPITSPTRLAWEWSDKSPYRAGSALWDGRTPSSSISSSECIALINPQSPTSSTRWSQYTCTSRYSYVCKFRASF